MTRALVTHRVATRLMITLGDVLLLPHTLIDALRKALPYAPVHDRLSQEGVNFQPWNTLKSGYPRVRVECCYATDVQKTLAIATSYAIPITVAGGRCDVYGRNNLDNALIIDLLPMTTFSFDEASGSATFGGGTTIAKLISSLPEGMVSVTGANGRVGMVGLALGGGYGVLNGRFGLTIDTLQRAEVVLADGNLVTASEQSDKDLFWAIRGGGSGFGVVTSMTLKCFELARLLNATVVLPIDKAKEALLQIQDCIDAEPAAVNIIPLFMMAHTGAVSLFLVFNWTGAEEAGEAMLNRFCDLPGAQTLRRGWVPYKETLDPEELWPWGRRWYVGTHTFARLDEALAEAIAESARGLPAPDSMLFLQGFHGAAAEVPADATAFNRRTPHFISATCTSWKPEEDGQSQDRRSWVDKVSENLGEHDLPGGYINFLPSAETARVRQFYAKAIDRLEATKRRVDPQGVFTLGTGRF